MKKLSLMMALIVMLGCMVFISGCGSDKFEGKWVGRHADIAVVLEVKKNGEGYILNSTNYTMTAEHDPDAKTIVLTGWTENQRHGLQNQAATVNDNVLTIRLWRPFEFVYDESTKELKGKVPELGDVTFERVDGDPLEQVQKQFIKQAKEGAPEYTVTINNKKNEE